MTVRRLFIGLVVTSLLATGTVGCGGEEDSSKKPQAPSSAAVTPGVQADGSYQLGTLGDVEAEAALKAAVETLPLAVSYDYRSLDETLAKATAAMTPSFGDEFREIFNGSTRAKALDEKAITSALVRGAGVIDGVADDQVTCLIYLDQVLVSSKFKKKNSPLKVKQNSVRVQMQKTDGTWKVAGIEPF